MKVKYVNKFIQVSLFYYINWQLIPVFNSSRIKTIFIGVEGSLWQNEMIGVMLLGTKLSSLIM